jgi:hypothetical protein
MADPAVYYYTSSTDCHESRTTSLFHALLSLVEEILDCPKQTSLYRMAVNRFKMGLEALGEMRKIYSAAAWGYLMFEQLLSSDFSNIKSSDRHGNRLTFTSRHGSPGPASDATNWYRAEDDIQLDPIQFLADQGLFFPDALDEGWSMAFAHDL